MKKITVNQARQLIEQVIFPKCEVSREVLKPVRSIQELENFLRLSSYQKCQFYGYGKKEIDEFKIPDGALPLTINQATSLLILKRNIFARVIGEDEQIFADLNSFVSFLKKCEIHGDSFLLYLRG